MNRPFAQPVCLARSTRLQKTSNQGFTLIEVIIIVALLAILAVIAFQYLNAGAMKKARDAERKDDLHRIKVAFEEYYSDNGCYPPPDILATCSSSDLAPYINQVPCDPATREPYVYLPYPDTENHCSGFRVYAPMEWSGDPVIANLGCTGGCGLVQENLDYYGVQRWQPEDYQYGVSEGVPVGLGAGTPGLTSGWCCINSQSASGGCQWFNLSTGGVCNGPAYASVDLCQSENNNCNY